VFCILAINYPVDARVFGSRLLQLAAAATRGKEKAKAATAAAI